jgi:hypothetical protein
VVLVDEGGHLVKHRRLLLTSLIAASLAGPSLALAQDRTPSIVGVWKLKAFSTKDVTTGKEARPFGEHPSGYFFFTRGGKVAFLAVGQDRKPPASNAPTDEERAQLYKSMIAAFTGSYKADNGKIVMQVDASWNQAWTGTEQPRNIQIAGSELTVTTPPLKTLVAGQEIVVTAIFDRDE